MDRPRDLLAVCGAPDAKRHEALIYGILGRHPTENTAATTPMSFQRTLRLMTRYSAWANQLIFEAASRLPPEEVTRPRAGPFKNIAHTLNHNYVIDQIFQAHLEGRPHSFTARNTAETPPLADLWTAQRAIDDWYVSFSDAANESELEEVIRFIFVGGGEGAMKRGEMVLHVVNHTTYHRGYVADCFYQIPARPPTTDLPVFLRDARPELE
jgi:uncharacterized damage-inducible protein DinB